MLQFLGAYFFFFLQLNMLMLHTFSFIYPRRVKAPDRHRWAEPRRLALVRSTRQAEALKSISLRFPRGAATLWCLTAEFGVPVKFSIFFLLTKSFLTVFVSMQKSGLLFSFRRYAVKQGSGVTVYLTCQRFGLLPCSKIVL